MREFEQHRRTRLETWIVAVAATAAVAAAAPRADVRALDWPYVSEPELAVHVTPAGPWSPMAPVCGQSLNPDGDGHGDGLPGSATAQARLLAAWVRPVPVAHVRLALWEEGQWTDWPDAPAPNATGTPRVWGLGDGWALTWQRGGRQPEVMATGAGGERQVDPPQALATGWLIDSLFIDDVQVLLVLTTDRRRLRSIGILWSVPGVPSPIDILWTTDVGAVARLLGPDVALTGPEGAMGAMRVTPASASRLRLVESGRGGLDVRVAGDPSSRPLLALDVPAVSRARRADLTTAAAGDP